MNMLITLLFVAIEKPNLTIIFKNIIISISKNLQYLFMITLSSQEAFFYYYNYTFLNSVLDQLSLLAIENGCRHFIILL